MAMFAAFFLSLILLCTIPGCFSGEDSPGSTAPGDDENQEEEADGAVILHTDPSGIADVRDGAGDLVFEAEVLDSLGSPLAGVELCYFLSSPNDMVCFVDSASGNAMGMFELVSGETFQQDKNATFDGQNTDAGVFILSLIDPTMGRLYDPERDGFAPTRSTTLQSVRRVMDFEDLTTIIEMAAGVTMVEDKTKAEIMESFANSDSRFFQRYIEDPSNPARFIIAQRVTRFVSFSSEQDDNYRYREYRAMMHGYGTAFYVPLGVQAAVTITNPVDGTTYTDSAERLQVLSGTINRPPVIVSSDGGHVDVWGNGALVSPAVHVSSSGSGTGSLFSTEGELQLAEGENTLQIVAYVSEVNRGFENGVDGEAGKTSVTVHYEPEEAEPTAPVLSGLSHPTLFGGPDGQFTVSFDYTDPDGDISLVWEHLTYFMLGQGGEVTASGSIYEHDDFACLRGTGGSCEILISYTGFTERDWFEWELWVEDSTGLSSNHLELLVTITAGGPILERRSSPRIERVIGSMVEL